VSDLADPVRVTRDGAVARVTLARPARKNALDRRTADALVGAITAVGAEVATTPAGAPRVLLLDADGDDFCAGADLDALAALLDAGPEAQIADAEALGAVFLALRALPLPTVAAVRGRALAGGAGLALACDVVVADADSRFGFPEVRVGFVPAMVLTMLRRAVGEKRAADLALTARTVGADEAARLGLASVVAPAGRFDETVGDLLERLVAMPPQAVRATKALLYELDGLGFEAGVARGVAVNAAARATAEFRDGVQAFARGRRTS